MSSHIFEPALPLPVLHPRPSSLWSHLCPVLDPSDNYLLITRGTCCVCCWAAAAGCLAYWQHICAEDGVMQVGRGEACNWCGATEPGAP